jgi:hypothetical protein
MVTRKALIARIWDEVDAWVNGHEDGPITVDDVDQLSQSLDSALEDCRGCLESQFGGTEKAQGGS